MTLAEWIEGRWRDDEKPAGFAVGALPAMWAAIERAGLAAHIEGVTVAAGPGAAPPELSAYEQSVRAPVPADLAEAWREVGPVRVKIGDREARWLSPKEILAERSGLRGLIRKPLRNAHPEMDVLALLDGKPALLFDAQQRQVPGPPEGRTTDRKVWYHFPSGEPYSSLAWMVSVHLNRVLLPDLLFRAPDVFLVSTEEFAPGERRAVHLTSARKHWLCLQRGSRLVVLTGNLMKMPRARVIECRSPALAAARLDALAGTVRAKGFT